MKDNKMDKKKFKSVAISIEIHKVLKDLALQNNRTVSGQLTHIIQNLLSEDKAA